MVDQHPADREATKRLLSIRPEWIGQARAGSLLNLPRETLLHAGPPFAATDLITRPILNSACVAAVYEGLAPDFDQARSAIMAGEITLMPAQDVAVVTPLASVVSMSMPLHVVSDHERPEIVSYAPVNGGGGPAMRLGLCNGDVLEHLRWLNDDFSEQLVAGMGADKGGDKYGPVELIPVAAESIRQGDDCHGRTIAATRIVATKINRMLDQRGREFLASGPSFFLNLWMAAVKCMMLGAADVAHSSLVTAAGANGRETAIQVSGLPGRWFTAVAGPPVGDIDTKISEDRKLGAIGDSAVVDALGLGAMSMNLAPAQKQAMGSHMPEGGLGLPNQLLAAPHPGFGDLSLRVGTLARSVVQTGRSPVVSLGILDNRGERGRLGGGIFTQPADLFAQAVMALER